MKRQGCRKKNRRRHRGRGWRRWRGGDGDDEDDCAGNDGDSEATNMAGQTRERVGGKAI